MTEKDLTLEETLEELKADWAEARQNEVVSSFDRPRICLERLASSRPRPGLREWNHVAASDPLTCCQVDRQIWISEWKGGPRGEQTHGEEHELQWPRTSERRRQKVVREPAAMENGSG
jgi:hypothetical protein